MRRFVAYATLAASMLVAVGVGVTPVLTQMQPSREFTNGREITFNVRAEDDGVLPEDALDEVANEMRNRLDSFDFEDYSIKIEDNFGTSLDEAKKEGSITVSLACEKDTFDNVCKYLTFSGENFSLSGVDEAGTISDVIDYKNVEIKQLHDLVPIVVIPLTTEGKTKVESLVNTLTDVNASEQSSIRRGKKPLSANAEGEVLPEEGQEDTPAGPDIFLWGNFSEGNNYESAQKDPLIGDKIIMAFSASSIWYTEEDGYDGDEVHTAIKYVCGSLTEDNTAYDYGKLKNANNMATYYYNMLHASKYNYEISCPTVNISTSTGIDYFTNSREVAPSAGEDNALFTYSNILTIKFTVTVLTTLIVLAAIAICFAIYFKLIAPAILATSISTTFLSFLMFSRLGALFNIPALIGGFIIFFASIFVEIFYINKFKEEVYKGRTLKKANQEASKKSNLVTLDVAIIEAFGGLMSYLLGGVALKSMGVALFFGSIISLLMNLIVFKGLMYLITNSTYYQDKQRYLGIKEENIPNLLLEQKQTYVSPLESVPFTKKSKLGGIILAGLSVLGLAGVLIFGIRDKSPLNIDKATQDVTVAYVEINTTASPIESETSFKEYALKDIAEEGVAEYEVVMKQVDRDVVNGDKVDSETSYFFTVKINEKYDAVKLDDIKENISNAIFDVLPNDYSVSVLNSHELVYTPNQGLVALATGISIACVMLYLSLRYKPSRGIAVGLVSAGASLSAYGILALTRIGTTAISSLAMPVIALTTIIAALPYLNLEKIFFKEYEGTIDAKAKNEIMNKAISKSAFLTVVFCIVNLFAAIVFFGFGMQPTTFMFAAIIIGELIGFAANYVVLGPLANDISNVFAKIHMPKFKFLEKKNTNNVQVKQNSSEPEETTFIGIND